MTRRAKKLEMKFKLDPEIAEALFAAGLTGTTKVRQATNAELLEIKGIGQATVNKLRR